MTLGVEEMSRKRKASKKYTDYLSQLSQEDRDTLSSWFHKLNQRLALPSEWRQDLIHDFENAFMFYSRHGVSIGRAIELMPLSSLGGFYSRPATTWYPLDNAAKVYPLSMSHRQMSVFRLSVYMDSDVVPEILQVALDFTIKRFPFFATTIKRGFFWHYIDSTKARFTVEPETYLPCAPMNVSLTGSQSFRVLYYKNRISAEFFHILTDGTGGMVFLKTLAAEYLRLMGKNIPCSDGVLDIDATPDASESADDFPGSVSGKRHSGFVDKPAMQLSGPLSRVSPCQVIHFDMSSSKLHALARSHGASVTALMVSMMFIACKAACDEHHGIINIQVPVNMRGYFDSKTLRNFSLYCGIKLPLDEIHDIGSVLPRVVEQLRENISRRSMQEMMNGAVKLVRSLRFIPLFIKAPVAKIVYGFLGDRVFTTTLSNLGVIRLPEEMEPYVEKMDFVLGTVAINRVACSMVTVGDTATFSITKLTADPSFEERMRALLTENGISMRITGSELYGS